MNKEILNLRLAMESKRWDEMVNRIESYLKDQIPKKNESNEEYFQNQLAK